MSACPSRRQHAGECGDTNHAAAGEDDPHLLVREVAGSIAVRAKTGVGGNQPAGEHLGDIPETGVREVGRIDGEPEAIQFRDQVCGQFW